MNFLDSPFWNLPNVPKRTRNYAGLYSNCI